jgi:hypothetical protein
VGMPIKGKDRRAALGEPQNESQGVEAQPG